MSVFANAGHLSDGTLVEIMDSESPSISGARTHLSECSDCTERFSILKRAAEQLALSLPDAPDRPLRLPRIERRRAWLISFPAAAAATIVILASVAAAMPGIRGWVIARVAPSAAAVQKPPTASSGTPAQTAAGIVVSFAPTDTVLMIRVVRAQEKGEVHLLGVGGSKASAQTVGDAAAVELVVLPSTIHVMNGAGSTAEYRITVPAIVRTVRVLIGEKETAVVVNDGRLDRRIPLR